MSYDVHDFEREVIQRSYTVPVLVDFWAEWCMPCRILSPVLERLAQKANGRWVLAKVNTEEHPELAYRYGVRSIPNVKLFVDGEVINEFVGALPEHLIERWLEQALPSPHRKLLQQAEELLQQHRISEAQEVLERVLAAEPHNEQARVLLARLLLFAEPDRARELVAPIEPGSPHEEVAEAIRTLAPLLQLRSEEELPPDPVRPLFWSGVQALQRGEFDTALEHFIEVIRHHRYYNEDAARRICIAIFKFLGEEHPITLRRRREFSSALYI
ncbi:Thioredoxin C-1 [bacterium HR21]|nr:Thioredoxin C-1 [bacterium HR21]